MSDETPVRRPRWVYDAGHEPDYRFSFANERTFLAWIRTALALVAAGVAVDVVDLDLGDAAQTGLVVVLVGLGLVAAALSWLRWAQAERAMRLREPLPAFVGGTLVAVVITGCALLVLLLLVR